MFSIGAHDISNVERLNLLNENLQTDWLLISHY